ncbi:hypothetical protein ACO22_05953 [Paracoccidioides brasiliensis]|uniref:Uncharacterized protein n=1 Tax=Paracoccidioides brasiliensis TaxID=121759 RepID=A0A1D2J8U1_PARBR|nr:hypothetical protein ACO22_05953 [Paracoccidioides brasiliensis]
MNNSKPISPLSVVSNGALPLLQTPSSTLTQSSLTGAMGPNITSSTPLSGLSNHDYPPFPLSHSLAKSPYAHAHSRSVDLGSLPSTNLSKTTVANALNESSSRVNMPTEIPQGQKRTANGEMKSTVFPAPFQSLKPVTATRRSRTMSIDSTGSRITELSAQLRARLSYAAAKVEKEWPIRTLEEEHTVLPGLGYSSTSQSPLPLGFKGSSSCPMRPKHSRARHSISSTSATDGFSKLRNPDSADDLVSTTPMSLTPNHNQVSSSNGNPRIPPLTPAAAFTNANPPKLAPPADIISGNGSATRRRPNPNDSLIQNGRPNQNNYQKMTFTVRGHSASSTQTTNSTVAILDSPPQSQPQLSLQSATPDTTTTTMPVPKLRTPSQNALMEKDAIETLLFMSSPENSGYHPSSQNTQQSDYSNTHLTLPPPPLPRPSPQQTSSVGGRLGLGIHLDNTCNSTRPPRKVSFADDISNWSNDAYLRDGSNGLREHEAGDAIDRMLDELGDSDSESEGSWLTRFMSQNDRGKAMRPNRSG